MFGGYYGNQMGGYPGYGMNNAVPDYLAALRMGQQQMPQTPQPQQMQSNAQPQNPQGNNGLIWVQGEAGAKSYMVAPGTSVFLMDSEENVFYLKSADASGMPLPLRIFDYRERGAGAQTAQNQPAQEVQAFDPSRFITREEFDAKIAQIMNSAKNAEE